jgi:GH24 family phage-related lysozyme (muramidase)
MGLVDMAFNMGLTKLKGFVEMRKGLDANDYAKVAKEAKDSDWFKQVKSRGKRTVGLFKKAIK